jgi:hypothetical protein
MLCLIIYIRMFTLRHKITLSCYSISDFFLFLFGSILCVRSCAIYIFNNPFFFQMELFGSLKMGQENGLSVKTDGKHRVEIFMEEEGPAKLKLLPIGLYGYVCGAVCVCIRTPLASDDRT